MTEAGPLTRIVRVDALPQEGQTVAIEASPAEREALASLYKLPAIAALTATLRLEPAGRGGARVTGAVHGEFTQICVVSLEPFLRTSTRPSTCGSRLRRKRIRGRRAARETLTLSLADEDDPDPVIDGKIDLGALTAEFFALGLDPYPRKPGAEFVAPAEPAPPDSPFAALAAKAGQAIDGSTRRRGVERPQSPLVEREDRRRQAEIKRRRAAARRHLALRLDEDVEHLLVRVLGGETRGVIAQEHQAGDVFEGLRLGVAAQPLLAHQRAGAGDLRLVVAATPHDLGRPAPRGAAWPRCARRYSPPCRRDSRGGA